SIASHMAVITGDQDWVKSSKVKTLTLEHHMAASRMGFSDAFSALYNVKTWNQSLLDGTLPPYRFFVNQVLPLVKAKRRGDRFAVARIIKSFSPLLTQAALRNAENQPSHLQQANIAIDSLMELWKHDTDPSLLDVLRRIDKNNLLEIPDSLRASASDAMQKAAEIPTGGNDEMSQQTEMTDGLEKFLKAPFSQIEPMAEYLLGNANFDTHQGVKGLEFDRVMVIMDDDEARGFSFKYDQLFGGKSAEGKTFENTRRLFYVTSSRARKSLALVAYASEPDRVRQFVLNKGWFTADELVGESDLNIPLPL
ncbi:hypothetical protein, partial [Myxococcus vastator]|uniref:hypothetical protein n=1 Tax=Myxococcus vastator TaxID=2709664 RepID=UPI001967FDAF